MWRVMTKEEFEEKGMLSRYHDTPNDWEPTGKMNYLYGKEFRYEDQDLIDWTYKNNPVAFIYVSLSLQDNTIVVRRGDTGWERDLNWCLRPNELKFEEIDIEF